MPTIRPVLIGVSPHGRTDPVPEDFGPCCCCGRPHVRARNIVMLPVPAPVPGTGWGCVQCGLPMDGAIYVACDSCVEGGIPPVEVCDGKPCAKRRVPFGALTGDLFEHDFSKHPEYRPEERN